MEIGLRTHLESEVTTTDDVSIGDVVLEKGLAVEGGRLDIYILRTVVEGFDDELLTVLERDGGFAEEGTANDILVGARCNSIEAKG